jgi:NADH-quinone oxidoreductase subunit L
MIVDMKPVVAALVIYPLVVSLLLMILQWRREQDMFGLVFIANLMNGVLTLLFVGLYIQSGFKPVEISLGQIIKAGDYQFDVMFLIDNYSVSFQLLIGILTGFVLKFSRRYMHRETGYIRFFASLFLFISGISLVALSATLDMLFAGWEMVGISSFLLIGFYRMRLQPGRNSLRTYAIYRFCDVGLFMGAWLFHKLGSEYFFLQYHDRALDPAFVQLNLWFFVTIGLLIVLAAMGKSAQFPFSFWVPRAMEGPTPSSAIFYGALSIHAGVYLLIRLYPLWRAVDFIPWVVGTVGLTTAITANLSLQTQSNVKGQIGYASVAQVGLMFVELALGWRELAMLHFLGNAALRCYQLLASPSIMVMSLRQQAEGEVLSAGFSGSFMRFVGQRMRHHLFAFSLSEGYAELMLAKLWRGLKLIGKACAVFFSPFIFINLVVVLLIAATFGKQYLGDNLNAICASVLGISAVFVALAALGLSPNPEKILWMTGLSMGFKGLSVTYLSPQNAFYSLLYFFGIAGGFVIAWIALRFIPEDLRSREYAGAWKTNPLAVNLFFIGILWMTGFTLSPTFFGDDILLHFGAQQFAFETFFMGIAFVLNAVALMRSYVKLAFAR